MDKKQYFITFFRRNSKVATGRIKSTSVEDAILDAEFKMMFHSPVFVYDFVTAEEIQEGIA